MGLPWFDTPHIYYCAPHRCNATHVHLISIQSHQTRRVTQAMFLNDLPPELAVRVISHLALLETPNTPYVPPKPRLRQYACTSLSLQHTIERHLFSHLSLKSNDLLAFEVIVVRSTRRRALLRSLCFQPVLPAYDIHACAQFEKPTDQQANVEAFTTTSETSLYHPPCLR